MFDDLNKDNFILYAMKFYENPQCLSEQDFHDDLKIIKYLKRLLNRYHLGGELKERLINNFHDYGIETRPIISGNLLRQPFLKDYTLGKENSIAEIVHNNGFYIGNNQFLGKNNFEILDEVILMTINNIKMEKN